jgi:hypothetical protein
MSTHEFHPVHDLPPAQSTHLINFETAEIISPMIYPPRPMLIVTGKKPTPTMKVSLVPLTYMRRPEYWGIEVVGSPSTRGELASPPQVRPTPYAVELKLDGVIGTVGIEVIGASHTEQIPLYTEDATQFIGAVEDGRFKPLYPSWVHDPSLRLTTVSPKDDAAPETGELDLARYNGSLLRVVGHHQDGWLYSTIVAEQARDSILSIVARQVFAGRER